jgi:hypothetical protein
VRVLLFSGFEMGGKKPIGAMPSRGGVQRYGSSRVRSLAATSSANHSGLPSSHSSSLVASAEDSGAQVYYSLFSGLNLADNGQPWIFKDERDEQRKEEAREEGGSEHDPKQRLLGENWRAGKFWRENWEWGDFWEECVCCDCLWGLFESFV